MKKGKYEKVVPAARKRHGLNTRIVTLVLTLALLVGGAVGGTIAWLTAKTEPVKNTFVAGQIGTLNLAETDTDTVTAGDQHKYIVTPGVDITKDPKVTYTPASGDGIEPVDAYVFVKLTGIGQNKWAWNNTVKQYEIKSGNDVVLHFSIAAGWTKLDDQDVFYQEVPATDTDGLTTSIIANDTITVSPLITKDNVQTVATAADGLTFTAYAIQQEGFEVYKIGTTELDVDASAAKAWTEVSGANASSGGTN